MSVLMATAYMEEAARFDWLVAMNAGRVLATGTPRSCWTQTGTATLEEAFIALLPQDSADRLPAGDDPAPARPTTERPPSRPTTDHALRRFHRR